MPIERLVDHERRLVEFVFLGPISKGEIVAHRREIEAMEPATIAARA